jgi:hypothetical protein
MLSPFQQVIVTAADDSCIPVRVTQQQPGPVAPSDVERVLSDLADQWRTVLPHLLPLKGWRYAVPEDVPRDRSYRNAWRDDGKAIVHDMPKAREIHREHIRARRKPLLESLDVEMMRALERDDPFDPERTRIVLRKQRLRDATDDPRIEAAQTIEELRGVDPLAEKEVNRVR